MKIKWKANEVDLPLPFIEEDDNVSVTPTIILHEMVLSTWHLFLTSCHSVCDKELHGFETVRSSTADHALAQTVSHQCFNILNS